MEQSRFVATDGLGSGRKEISGVIAPQTEDLKQDYLRNYLRKNQQIQKLTESKERRHIQGLEGKPLNGKDIMSNTTVQISLIQLLDIAPLTRIDAVKMLRLTPTEGEKKGTRPTHWVRINAVAEH
ncbi:hypothetical protein APSETT444_002162 [Aspergillus pseudonomiae]